jgi:putative ATP-binding cassette transporter
MAGFRGGAWSRFLALTRPFFRSAEGRRGIGLLLLLLLLLLAINGLNVVNNFVGGDFMTAISKRQADRFIVLALVYAGVFAASTVVAVFSRFAEERLGLLWRNSLTRHLVDRYLSHHAYYRLTARKDIDNPDQRIAEDVKTFTVTALSFLLIAVNSTITLCSFSGILWSITPWLFVTAVLYAAFGSYTTIFLGRKLIGLNVRQLQKEADLRYELIQVRTRAEPIALLRGEADENRRIRGRLDRVVENMKAMIALNRNVGFFTVGYNYLIQLIPALVVAPLYIRGEIEFGKVTQAAMAFAFVMNAFSLIVEEFQRISSFGAVIERLGSAWEVIQAEESATLKPTIEMVPDSGRVAFERLTLATPRDGRLLIKDLTLEVPRGRRLLITGPTGSGKTALLRTIAGLWTAGAGRIVRPPLEDVMFLPEQPYVVAGTLREQLAYAVGPDRTTDGRMLAVLRKVRLGSILDQAGGLDVERDWPNVLSLSEQQELAFARLLLANPRFAFLDEATSALDPEKGRSLYEMLSRTGITYISVVTDPGLMDYHDMHLELGAHGEWELARNDESGSLDRFALASLMPAVP